MHKAWNYKEDRWGIAVPWDGTCSRFPGKKYNDHKKLFIGEDGSIFYLPYGENRLAMWCSAEHLGAHLHRLNHVVPGGVMIPLEEVT